MSVHTFRQRSALQRAQARWRPRANHLRLVQITPATPTWLDHLCTRLWRIHDGRWLWVIAAVIVGAYDLHLVAQLLGWWHP
ncbi:hypothetical protein [Rhodanobacter thiooxydans]|uniref:hypothetical protein n=1 Tax=Rhodanobacter thiooxydans TaxID=416169 RepID=UPI000260DA28|nr:hypothetical protein [Rhodanobacter thiooxydans]EIL99121.1 hypothetical protein UUA_08946 [Rhodanobacter thiooxydans LCS2]